MNFTDHRESERLVRALTNRVVRRLASIKQPIMSREDIEQELWIAWCKARDRFDEELGIPFGAFVQRGMKQHINRQIEYSLERFSGQTFARSLDTPIGDEGQMTLGDVISDNINVLPADQIEQNSSYEAAIRCLSPNARIFVQILNDQPQEILQEILMARDKAEHAVGLNTPYVAPQRITKKMVFDLMGVSRRERGRVVAEVKKMGERLSK